MTDDIYELLMLITLYAFECNVIVSFLLLPSNISVVIDTEHVG